MFNERFLQGRRTAGEQFMTKNYFDSLYKKNELRL